jgi:hypothetical protein
VCAGREPRGEFVRSPYEPRSSRGARSSRAGRSKRSPAGAALVLGYPVLARPGLPAAAGLPALDQRGFFAAPSRGTKFLARGLRPEGVDIVEILPGLYKSAAAQRCTTSIARGSITISRNGHCQHFADNPTPNLQTRTVCSFTHAQSRPFQGNSQTRDYLAGVELHHEHSL